MSDEVNDIQGEVPPDVEQVANELGELPPEEMRYMQLVMTMQKVTNDIQQWLQKAEGALHNHNLRLNVIETLLCHSEFKELRTKFFANELELNDLQKIAADFIQPQLQARAEEMRKAQAEYMEAQAKAAGQPATPSIINPNTGLPADEKPSLLTPDGRRIILQED
jgi:hypothetical protein